MAKQGNRRTVLAFIAVCSVTVSIAGAQAPRVAPALGYQLYEEKTVDRFAVQKWVSGINPEVSPAGFCDCITVIYDGNRLVLNLGVDRGISDVSTVADVTGDRQVELVVSTNSGGAHCCQSTAIYSIDNAGPRTLLSLNTGDCPAELIDLDKNGTPEFETCDATYGYVFCPFAYSPLPPVVFMYDRRKGEFVLATPRYQRYLQLRSATEARKTMAEYPNDPAIARCAALGPALGLIYTGRVQQGQRLFRQLYRGTDAAAIELKAVAMAKQSTLWVPR